VTSNYQYELILNTISLHRSQLGEKVDIVKGEKQSMVVRFRRFIGFFLLGKVETGGRSVDLFFVLYSSRFLKGPIQ